MIYGKLDGRKQKGKHKKNAEVQKIPSLFSANRVIRRRNTAVFVGEFVAKGRRYFWKVREFDALKNAIEKRTR